MFEIESCLIYMRKKSSQEEGKQNKNRNIAKHTTRGRNRESKRNSKRSRSRKRNIDGNGQRTGTSDEKEKRHEQELGHK